MKNSLPPSAMLAEKIREITEICHTAWQKNLLDGWSGNASLRLENPEAILITASGSPKGSLDAADYIVMDLSGEILKGEKKPSSESFLHIGIYRKFPACKAVLHTHPVCLQAASLILASKDMNLENDFLNIDLYEVAIWRKKLFFAAAQEPGSRKLAIAAQNAIPESQSKDMPCAIWLKKHGLCALGKNLRDALCLTEEMEHLAKAQIACFSAR